MAILLHHPYLQAALPMKTRLLLLVGLALCALSVFGQGTAEPLQVELRLSAGRYPEAIANDTLHRIGQFGYNTVTGKAYRFGAHRPAKNDELHGASGTSYNYLQHIHDPRVGRFLSIDPLTRKYPYWAPYAFSGNRVIDAAELEGLEPASIIDSKGKVTGPIIGFITGATNISADVSRSTTWVMGTPPDDAGAITLFSTVIYSSGWAALRGTSNGNQLSLSADEIAWIGLVSHEHTHRDHIEAQGAVSFYSEYGEEFAAGIASGLSWKDAYHSISTELIAYNVEDRITDYLKSNSNPVASILNSNLSNERKELNLRHVGLRDVYIPSLENVIGKVAGQLNSATGEEAGFLRGTLDVLTNQLNDAQTRKAELERQINDD